MSSAISSKSNVLSKRSIECSEAVVNSSMAHADCKSNSDEKKARKCCSEGHILPFCVTSGNASSLIDDFDEYHKITKFHKNCTLNNDDGDNKTFITKQTKITRKSTAQFAILDKCWNGPCPNEICTSKQNSCRLQRGGGNLAKIMKRTYNLAKPKKFTPKYDPTTKKSTDEIQPVPLAALNYKITERTDNLALPPVR